MPQTNSSATSENKPRTAVRGQLQYLALVPAAIVVAALYFGRPVLLPLAIAILLAFALAPLVGWMRSLGVGRVSSVLLSGIAAIALLIAVGGFIGSQVVRLAGELPRYQNNLAAKIQTIRGSAIEDGAIARASSMLNNLRDQVLRPDLAARPAPAPRLSPRAGAEPVPVQIREPDPAPLDLFIMLVTPLVVPLAVAGIILVFVIFILLHKEDLRDRFIRLAGSRDMQRTTLLLDEGAEKLGRYLLAQTGLNAVFGLLIAGGLWLIGVPNPLLWGLGVMILRFVPYVGVPLAAIPALVLALSIDPGWTKAVLTLVLFFGGELIVGQAVEPWLYGRGMGLSAVAVVVAATFWTWLWGPVGLLLSTPLTMCLMVLGRHVEHLQFLEVLLGDRPALAIEEALYLRMLGDDADEAAAEAESFIKENSLCRYFDEVALRALALAQADVNRGALDPDRVVKIRDTTRALIDNLSDRDSEALRDRRAQAEDPQPAKAKSEARKTTVLCVAGRGPLDEAAALLLVHLLGERNVGARVASSTEVSALNVGQLDIEGIRAVCLCYLEPGNFARARYLFRRIRRRLSDARIVAAFWGYGDDAARAADAMQCEVVTGLDQAVDAILATLDLRNPPSTGSASRPTQGQSRPREARLGGMGQAVSPRPENVPAPAAGVPRSR